MGELKDMPALQQIPRPDETPRQAELRRRSEDGQFTRVFEGISGGFQKFMAAEADHMSGRCICKGGLCSDYCPWAMWKVFGQADPSWMGEEVNAPAPPPSPSSKPQES